MPSDILQIVLNRIPGECLYHYTSQTGFMGILESEEIWATHTQYLNDQQEFLAAISLVETVIRERQASSTEDAEQEVLDDMMNGIDGKESINVCVASFSSIRDSLSQWRAYSGTGSGFALGFSGAYLKEIADRLGFYLAPCIYNYDDKRTLVGALVDFAISKNLELMTSGKMDEYPTGGVLAFHLNVYAPMIKDAAFEEEKEWRLISRPVSCRSERFAFREGSSMIIPYYKIPLTDSEGEFLTERIIIGPCQYPQEALSAATSLVVSQGHKKFEVTRSSIPLRSI